MNDDMFIFGMKASAYGGGGDTGKAFPSSDAADFGSGARFVPGEVTLARRRGENVRFVQDCGGQCCWYWELKHGKRIYHFEGLTYDRLGGEPCRNCGNANTSGGAVEKSA